MTDRNRLSNSRARLIAAGRESIQNQSDRTKPLADLNLGEVYGRLDSRIDSMEEEMSNGDLGAAKQQAEQLVIDGLTLLSKIMIYSRLISRNTATITKLEYALYFGLGVYTEQEDTKSDQWADESYGDLLDHITHEVGEIRRNVNDDQMNFLLHNSADFVTLSTMILVTIADQTTEPIHISNTERS